MIHTPISFFNKLFLLLVVIGVLHITGLSFFLYWRLEWYDLLVHTLSGAWVGGMALWFYYLSGYMTPHKETLRSVVLISVVSALLVGVSWEVFEYLVGATLFALPGEYFFDTATDLFVDGIGGYIIARIFMSRKQKIISDIEKIETQISH